MRIGIDASRAFVDQPTGTERYSLEMIRELLDLPEAKSQTWTLFIKAEQLHAAQAFLSGKQHIRVIVIPRKRLWTQVGLAWKTWTSGIDVLWVPAHTLPILRKPGLKTVVTIHGIEYEWLPAYENRLQRWYLPLSTKYAALSASRVVAVSQFTKDQLVKRLGVDEKKIDVVWEGYTHNAHSDPALNLREGHFSDVLKKFTLVPKKYIIFVGTVQPRKNLVRLIEAFAGLDNSSLMLVISGKLGWMYDDVLGAAKRFGVEDKVVFTGYISDAERYTLLHYALFYIQPSITEGFGLPILEAWQAGLAVASSRGGALSEIVGDAGILFDPTSVSDIVEAMKQMTRAKIIDTYAKMGKERLVLFSWKKAAESVLELFNVL